MIRAALILTLASLPTASHALCATGAKCVTVPQSKIVTPKFKPGDRLAPGSFRMITNATYYGLPPSDGSTWYVRVDNLALKIDPQTYTVIADVTHLTNSFF